MVDYAGMSLKLHEEHKGKLEVVSKVKVETRDDLSVAYTPGVAQPCLEISRDKSLVYKYTVKGNMVAVVTDGSAVLGLGNIGPEAAIPVMEGKAVLFKEFANVDAFPICLATQEVDEIVNTVRLLEPMFGGINLEDISAPRCFEIEEKLKAIMDIPVFHDDQHGTAVVVAAAMINALKLTGKRFEDLKIVINGAGAAGIAISKLLYHMGVRTIVLCGRQGAIGHDSVTANKYQMEMVKLANLENETGSLEEVIKGKDVFVGVSAPGTLTTEMVRTMAKDPMVFAMANPTPEIMPEEAKAGGAHIMGTGRSDFNNQINNVLAFPGIFRGAFDVNASEINEAMKIAAAQAIADIIDPTELTPEYIIPSPLDRRVAPKVAAAVREAAIRTGVARK